MVFFSAQRRLSLVRWLTLCGFFLAGVLPRTAAAASVKLERAIGQMVLVGFHGTRLDDPRLDLLREQIVTGQIGGVILYGHNIVDRGQLRQLVSDLKALPAPEPLLVAIDQEGGAVQRLKSVNGFRDYPAAAAVAATLSPEEAFRLYRDLAEELREVGFNLNFGPVLDLAANPHSPAIAGLGRAFSADPQVVADFAGRFVAAHRRAGVLTCVKHFPGHGSAATDTHLGAADVSESWRSVELEPYRDLLRHGMVDMVMTGHVFQGFIDETWPASLSARHIQDLLRCRLGWQGVVVTDDLQMGAIAQHFGFSEVADQAIVAGSDLLLFSNFHGWDPQIPGKVRAKVLSAIAAGTLPEERIRESYRRIVTLKRRLPAGDRSGDQRAAEASGR